MKRLLYLSIIAISILNACSKKSNNVAPANTININGTYYSTVKIGTQTWTSVNYNGPGGVNYNNSQVNDPVYGKLYTYTEAQAIPVPEGWHLPAQNDFATLLIPLGADPANGLFSLPDTSNLKLLSKTTWTKVNGTNSTGFNAIATGFVHLGSFSNLGDMTNILTTSEFPDGEHMSLQIFEIYGTQIYTGLNSVIPNATDRGSVRFVKDN